MGSIEEHNQEQETIQYSSEFKAKIMLTEIRGDEVIPHNWQLVMEYIPHRSIAGNCN